MVFTDHSNLKRAMKAYAFQHSPGEEEKPFVFNAENQTMKEVEKI